MNAETVYRLLPVPLQHLVVSAEGWRIQRLRFRQGFDSVQEAVRRRGSWPEEQMRRFRDERLARFVAHAAQNVPFYRRCFAERGLKVEEIRSLNDLKKLPVLSKAEVQTHAEQLIAENIHDPQMIHSHTSGTTGGGLKFPVTLAAHQEQWAVWQRYREWHGLRRDEPCLFFGGRSVVPVGRKRPPFWRYNWPGRQILFSGYHIGPETAACYLDEIERSRYQWIHGYPSLVSLLAHFAVQANRYLPMKWVTLGAESLFPQQAVLIEAAFGVRPLQHYGMAEQVANISLCPQGALHVDEDFAAVEFDPIGGGEYRVLGTNLANLAFPLIRYDVGDVVTLGENSCSCGRPGRIVQRIDGRKEDYVVTRSGALLGRLDHIFKDMVNVREAQIVQQNPGFITLRIVKGPNYTDRDEQRLRAETFQRTGREVQFVIEYVAQIPRTKNGKLRFVVSSVAPSDLRSTLQRPDQSSTRAA
jgi:phenylacetate-CoA ligase